ncbi:hypothetical protein AXE65_10315 [Ventosimonas gracilis]|uniref:Uncharacterized protein n=1 Tax=Ventosimonas gracilis TaxID=1680762 RepID=A0A139SWX8_9GAMM|nr:hypothetical protein AXE65_10315 [Ventosimonas gracilis]
MRACAWLLCSLLPAVFIPAQAAELVHYPRHSSDANPERYATELLNQALKRGGEAFSLQPSPLPMSPARAMYSLQHNDGKIQVLWAMSADQRTKALQAVSIPIYRDLIGWRVLLVRSKDKPRLASINTLSELAHLRFGQRSEWSDVDILRANGLRVQTSNAYPSLFSMLNAGRFDLLPLEILVAAEEQQRFAALGLDLALDDHLLLHYPSTYYYFTSKQNPKLAAAIRRGLEAMLADGSFDRLFNENFAVSLRALNLENRQVIELSNPLLPEVPSEQQKRHDLLWQKRLPSTRQAATAQDSQ